MESQEAFEIIANTMVFFHLLVPQEILVKSYWSGFLSLLKTTNEGAWFKYAI